MNTCSGCDEDSTTLSHSCDYCGRKNHPFCGIVVGEGFGGAVRCVGCIPLPTTTKRMRRPSASPIIAAFARALAPRSTPQTQVDDEEKQEEDVHCGGAQEEALDGSQPRAREVPDVQATLTIEDATAVTTEMYEAGKGNRKRRVQVVATVAQRLGVIKRMEELDSLGEKHVMAKVVREFPAVFSGVYASDIEKARYWWQHREKYLQGSLKSISAKVASGRTRATLKVTGGRGRKRADWVIWLHARVVSDFLRLRALGIKISYSILQDIAKKELSTSISKWKAHTVVKKETLISRISIRWIQSMCERHGIVLRSVPGKLSLDFCGASSVKYDGVVSGGEAMTLVVTFRGEKNARLETPMLIFTNARSSYPIRGVPPIPGVVYRSGPRGWMDRRVFCEWLKSDQCVRRDPHGRRRVIFMDNVAGHKAIETMDDEAKRLEMTQLLERKNVAIRFLPPNSTHLCQPADLMIIQKFKQVWRQEWEQKKLDLAETRDYSNIPNEAGEWSGKLNRPDKSFYLKLAVQCVRRVSEMRDDEGVNVVRKAMIRCGLNKNLNDKWEESQLFPELQAIISKYREHFDGQEPVDFCAAIV